MNEYGQVVRVDGSNALVLFKRSSACGRCKACGMLSNQAEIIVEVPNDLGAKTGEFVEVNIVMKKAIRASAIAYIFPLAMLILGAVLGWLLTDKWAVFNNRDLTMAFCALIFTALSFLLLKFAAPLYNNTVRRVYTMVSIKKDCDEEKADG